MEDREKEWGIRGHRNIYIYNHMYESTRIYGDLGSGLLRIYGGFGERRVPYATPILRHTHAKDEQLATIGSTSA